MITLRSQPRCVRCKGFVDIKSEPYYVSQEEFRTSVPVYVHRRCFECMQCTTPLNLRTAVFPKNSGLILCQRDFKDYFLKSYAGDTLAAPVITSEPEPNTSDSSEGAQPIFVEFGAFVAPASSVDDAPSETVEPQAQARSEPSSPQEIVSSEAETSPSTPHALRPASPVDHQTSPSMLIRYPSGSLLPVTITFPKLDTTTPTTATSTVSTTCNKWEDRAKLDLENNNNLRTDESCDQFLAHVRRRPVKKELMSLDVSEESFDEVIEAGESMRRSRRRKPTKTGKFRAYLTDKHKHVLEKTWHRCKFPGMEERVKLGKQLGLDQRQVQIWFQNQRRNSKTSNV